MRGSPIQNVAGAFGSAQVTDTQVIAEYINNSGGALKAGDVVVGDAAGINASTTTTANDPLVVGVVLPSEGGMRTVGSTETYAAGALMPVCIGGMARVNIAANTVTAGTGGAGGLAASGVAKVAAQPAAAASVAALQTLLEAVFAIPFEASAAKDANNTIRCLIVRS